ncbi:MAG: flagellar hook-basal body complex protein [Clostridiales bacterium]|nr:flagellar hook-basal body complex protein [Clostridiales bacterium]
MYAAISGLKGHMNKLNVVGNNIANVNTQGYKSQRAVFADSLYTTVTAGSNGTVKTGGRNPSQMGYGVQMTSIDIDMSTGNYSPTGRALDCMIYGQGFFMIGDKDTVNTIDPTDPQSLKALTLSRVGNFEFKSDGYLSKEKGEVLYGFMCIGNVEGEPVFSDQLVPIRFPRLKTTIQKDADGNDVEVKELVYPTVKAGQALADDDSLPFATFDDITIDPSTGRVTATCEETEEVITIGVIAIGNVTNPNGVTHMNGHYYKAGDGAGDLQVALMGGVGKEMYFSNTNPVAGDKITDAKFSKGTGTINGSLLPAGATAPPGMNVFESGSSLQTGGLESSKTDLATEISEMITTQRGYQANTRIITVTDTMLEELVNMKR